ncbi:(2Fe-2S)-binding protein [Poseidonocella sedimentorum]|uniref:2Fe-2S iron-sulfur cluster binding domain-containing protein n=1 Tax=Poseidonocella sedimentorum TaxID=871652 RepID=A0A1I6E6I3_9RHOB|nr:(2Fe-2S)-binding protein [Poseidonocella sedimentorum]SFR13267.1 2Fe-2S iron-sulfur cluster binding domain-containing protein [Poseidonocella sedimentorum]
MIRLVPNQATQITRSEKVTFTFDGTPVTGHAGESLVAALMRAGYLALRNAPNDAAPRGAFCGMGLCQECTVMIDGQVVEACRTGITPGLTVERV